MVILFTSKKKKKDKTFVDIIIQNWQFFHLSICHYFQHHVELCSSVAYEHQLAVPANFRSDHVRLRCDTNRLCPEAPGMTVPSTANFSAPIGAKGHRCRSAAEKRQFKQNHPRSRPLHRLTLRSAPVLGHTARQRSVQTRGTVRAGRRVAIVLARQCFIGGRTNDRHRGTPFRRTDELGKPNTPAFVRREKSRRAARAGRIGLLAAGRAVRAF